LPVGEQREIPAEKLNLACSTTLMGKGRRRERVEQRSNGREEGKHSKRGRLTETYSKGRGGGIGS